MPPGRGGKSYRIVIAIGCNRLDIGRKLVSLVAGNVAGLTANAERGISEKSHLTHADILLSVTAVLVRPANAAWSRHLAPGKLDTLRAQAGRKAVRALQYCHLDPGASDALDAYYR